MPSPELASVRELLAAAPLFAGDDVAAMRANMEAMAAAVPLAEDVRVTPVDADGVRGEWVEAGAVRDDACMLYLHGGGYVIGSTRTHRGLIAAIGRAAGVRMLAVDYRLAPENPHPAAVEDVVRAYRFLCAAGVPPERIAIAGDSAGGGLTVAGLLALRDANCALPALGICISPWLDLTQSGESMLPKAVDDPMLKRDDLERMAAMYAGDGRRLPTVSPLFADLRGLPEILVQVGTAEILLDDALRFVARLRECGVEVSLDAYEDMVHVWHAFFSILPEARDAIERIGDLVRRRLSA